MKFLSLLFLLASVTCFANQSVVRDASSTNIPAAYTTAGGEILSSVRANAICCTNHTGSDVVLCLRASAAASCGDDWYLADGAGFCFDDMPLADSVFAKGASGAISAGYLACRVWVKN